MFGEIFILSLVGGILAVIGLGIWANIRLGIIIKGIDRMTQGVQKSPGS